MSNVNFYFKYGAAAVAVAAVLLTTCARADTFKLTGDPGQVYNGENVGPYPVSLDGFSHLAFCLDESLTSIWGVTYDGTVHSPNTQAEEEAAFLASYALYDGAPSSNSNSVNTVEGPISYAIWEIMTPSLTLSLPASVVAAASPFINLAEYAYGAHLIDSTFLSSVAIFVPTTPGIQRFVMAVSDPVMDHSAIPEPSTIVLFGTGVLLIGLGRFRRRQKR